MLGGLSTTFVGRADVGTTKGERLLAALQRIEYAKARELRVGSHIHSMSGAGALYRVDAVEHVIADRGALFDERRSNLVEDFETTLTLKRLGWSVTAHSWCVCSTDVMTSVPELLAQRERWTRGTIDELRRHGLTSYTMRTAASIVVGVLLSIWFLAYPAIIVAVAGVVSVAWIVPGLIIVPVFNAWAARSLGWRIIAVELAILPELVYHLLRTWWLAKSVVMSYSSRPQAW
jgi:cellulose synthase/poly-beta-1,6-N-acetylglucosamine synthase-like glycosyltransferase